jgi:hypothetical protein
LREWHDRYKDQGLVILGVTGLGRYEDRQSLKDFAERHNVAHTLLGVSRETMATAGLDYDVQYIPKMVLIDRQGIVRLVEEGADPAGAKAVEATIRKLLAG